MELTQQSVTSRDGTTIALERMGAGPAIVLVAPALSDRSGYAKLTRHLAAKFSVINYDRRGRGQSGDTLPYAAEREVEDLAAVIQAGGGEVYLFGSSSGAVLALNAANRLGNQVLGLFLYEPPLIVDGSHPPMPQDLARQIQSLVASGSRHEAVKLFFHKGMGIPSVFVTMMRWLMPGWSRMAAIAHTIPYDLAILDGTQTGCGLPADRWVDVQVPTLVMVGGRSEAFFHAGAKALTEMLPSAEYRRLEGGHHGSVVMGPKGIAAAIEEFFLGGK